MSKKNIRLLALGFLLSALLLITLDGLFQSESKASDSGETDDLQQEIYYLEEKMVSLELENENLLDQVHSMELSIQSEEVEKVDEIEEVEESVEEEEPEEDTVETYTIVINENEPSSVIADQLVSFGLIEDRHAFNAHLEDSGAYLRVRAGSYTVSSDMNRDEIVEAIIN